MLAGAGLASVQRDRGRVEGATGSVVELLELGYRVVGAAVSWVSKVSNSGPRRRGRASPMGVQVGN